MLNIRMADKNDIAVMVEFLKVTSVSFEEIELPDHEEKLNQHFQKHLGADLIYFISEDMNGHIVALCGIQVIEIAPTIANNGKFALMYGPSGRDFYSEEYLISDKILIDEVVKIAKKKNITKIARWSDYMTFAWDVECFE